MLATWVCIELARCGPDELREEAELENLGEADGGREGDVDLAMQRLADRGTRGLHPRGEFSLRDAPLLHPKEHALQEHLPVSILCPHNAVSCITYNTHKQVPLLRPYTASMLRTENNPQTSTYNNHPLMATMFKNMCLLETVINPLSLFLCPHDFVRNLHAAARFNSIIVLVDSVERLSPIRDRRTAALLFNA